MQPRANSLAPTLDLCMIKDDMREETANLLVNKSSMMMMI